MQDSRKKSGHTLQCLTQFVTQLCKVCHLIDNEPNKQLNMQVCIANGVAFHHAGLEYSDRLAIEKAYRNGQIGVICCTSTLAVGVNLPCHFVIIKNTVSYHREAGIKEYPDLEIMQMLGRAGRPQYDRDAIAVIMTRQEKVRQYENLIAGQEMIESRYVRYNLVTGIAKLTMKAAFESHRSLGT